MQKINNKYLLNKKTGKNFCDELWTLLVKTIYNNKCPICESLGLPLEEKMLNAHHLISRRIHKYRWDTQNGILICPKHHEFDLYLSAHTAPWGFEEWMAKNDPEKYSIWVKNRKELENTEPLYYDEIYLNLENEYKALTGDYFRIKRIGMYLLYQNKDIITLERNINNKSVAELAEKYDVTTGMLEKFLKLEKSPKVKKPVIHSP